MADRPSLSSRKADLLYFVYFVQHAVVTVLIDSTVIIPPKHQFGIQSTLANFHIESNKDLLLLARPVWLQSYIWLEILFQLPLFLIGPYFLYKDSKKIYLPMLIYAVEAATTTFACMVEAFALGELTLAEKLNLQCLYAPILLVSLGMTVDMFARISKWVPREEFDKAK